MSLFHPAGIAVWARRLDTHMTRAWTEIPPRNETTRENARATLRKLQEQPDPAFLGPAEVHLEFLSQELAMRVNAANLARQRFGKGALAYSPTARSEAELWFRDLLADAGLLSRVIHGHDAAPRRRTTLALLETTAALLGLMRIRALELSVLRLEEAHSELLAILEKLAVDCGGSWVGPAIASVLARGRRDVKSQRARLAEAQAKATQLPPLKIGLLGDLDAETLFWGLAFQELDGLIHEDLFTEAATVLMGARQRRPPKDRWNVDGIDIRRRWIVDGLTGQKRTIPPGL